MTEQSTLASDQLRSIVGRIERLEDEKAEIASDIRDVYAEAKGNGLDVKALRAIVKMRKQDKTEREELQATVDTYLHALGDFSNTELGQSAIDRAAHSSKKRLREGMKDQKEVARELADLGMISPEAAEETERMCDAIAEKFGDAERTARESTERVDRIAEQARAAGIDPDAVKAAAASPRVRRAFKQLGTPVPLTEEEKAKGCSAAVIGKDGTRVAIGVGRRAHREKREEAT